MFSYWERICKLCVNGIGPGCRNVDLDERGRAGVDGLMVHVDDVLALAQVGLRGGILHVLDGFFLRHDLGEGEERMRLRWNLDTLDACIQDIMKEKHIDDQ